MEAIFEAILQVSFEIIFEILGEIAGGIFEIIAECVISHNSTDFAQSKLPTDSLFSNEIITLDLLNQTKETFTK